MLQESPVLFEMGRNLRKVLATGESDGRDDLRKLQKLPGLVAPMSDHMACGVLHVPWTAPCVSNVGGQGRARK